MRYSTNISINSSLYDELKYLVKKEKLVVTEIYTNCLLKKYPYIISNFNILLLEDNAPKFITLDFDIRKDGRYDFDKSESKILSLLTKIPSFRDKFLEKFAKYMFFSKPRDYKPLVEKINWNFIQFFSMAIDPKDLVVLEMEGFKYVQ